MVKKSRKGESGNGEPIIPVHMSGKEVEGRLLEAGSEEEVKTIHKVLRLEGVPDGTITAIISRLKGKGQLVFQTSITEYAPGTKPLAVEAIIHEMKLPAVILDGGREIFDAGVTYGMNALVAGVRLAQELSQMGIAQASPIIRMATEMRKAEGMSAREAGQVAAEDALAGAIQFMTPQKADIATVPNPMMGIMARAMEPALMQVFGKMTGMFGGQPAPVGSGQVQTPASSPLPPTWVDESKKE